MFTSRSNDRGADVVGMPPKSDKYVVIQCKHTGSSSVGRNGVDDLVRACDFYQVQQGILATNAKLSAAAAARVKELRSQYAIQVWDFGRLQKLASQLKPSSANRKEPRSYQAVAIDKALDAFNQGTRGGLVVFATGLGKSILLAEISAEYAENRGLPVLLMADRVPLIEQLESSLWSQLGPDTSTRLWDGDRKPRSFDGVTVATQQSVYSYLKGGCDLPRFGAVLIDECHHAASSTYRETINMLQFDHLFGVTATPWRGDEQSVSDVFGEVVSEMGLVEGIRRGFLADVEYSMFFDNVDWEIVQAHSEKSLSIKDLNARLFLPARDEDLCASIIREWNECGQPMVITFCRSIDHAERLAELCTVMGLPSKAIHSRDMHRTEQARLLMQFRAGEFANLVSVDVLNEGVDVPDVGMVVFARVTHSRRIFVQQLGRGLRVTDEKDTVRVLDFVADVRRLAEGFRVNRESQELSNKVELYRGAGADLISFSKESHGKFVEEYLADVADLGENDKVNLDFLVQ
jgi:superfamily II DNA or RNA helicase